MSIFSSFTFSKSGCITAVKIELYSVITISDIKFFVSGGSKLNPEITKDFYILGIKICEGYGMTETSPIISYTPKNNIVFDSAGKVIKDVEVKIADDNEILVKGRNVMKGYY